MIWLVITNTSACRIFEYQKKEKKLSLIRELFHPESKLKGMDLMTDGPGHYKTDGSGRGSYMPHEEPKEIEIEQFAREIAHVLDHGKATNQFQDLILVIPPHMNGLIHQHLDHQLKNCVLNNIVKDYTHLKEHEILGTLTKDIHKMG